VARTGRLSDAVIVVGDHVRRRQDGVSAIVGTVVAMAPPKPPWEAVMVRWPDREDPVEEDPRHLVRVRTAR
jgi:hypothetical protein